MSKYVSDNIYKIYIGQKIEESIIINIINSMFDGKISNFEGIESNRYLGCLLEYEYNQDKVSLL